MADTKLFSSQMSNPLPGNARLTLKKSDGSEIGSYEPLGEDKELTLPTGGSDNVFFATYGTTTLREVLDAIAADKLVIARDLNNNQYTIAEATEVRAVFESVQRRPQSTAPITYERLVLVDSPIIGGGWSSESQVLAKKSDLIVHHDATLDGDGTEANPLKVVGDAKDVFYFNNDVEGDVFGDALSKGKFLVYQTNVTSGSPRPTSTTRNFVLVNREQRAGDSSVSFLFVCVDGETIYKVSIGYDMVAETLTFGDVASYAVKGKDDELEASKLSAVAHDSTLQGDGTTDNPLTVIGGGGQSGVMEAEWDETPFDDIVQAIDSGKIVTVKYYGNIYRASFLYRGQYVIFESVDTGTDGILKYSQIKCTPNGWSAPTFTTLATSADIPKNTSELVNDSGFIGNSELEAMAEKRIVITTPPGSIQQNYNFAQGRYDADTTTLHGYLFAVPNEVLIKEDETKITVLCTSVPHNALSVGIFEYDFNGNEGRGSTTWLCDTGSVELTVGENRLPVKYIKRTTPTQPVIKLDPSKVYYACLMIGPTKSGFDDRAVTLASSNSVAYTYQSNPTLVLVSIVESSEVDWSVGTMENTWFKGYVQADGPMPYMMIRNGEGLPVVITDPFDNLEAWDLFNTYRVSNIFSMSNFGTRPAVYQKIIPKKNVNVKKITYIDYHASVKAVNAPAIVDNNYNILVDRSGYVVTRGDNDGSKLGQFYIHELTLNEPFTMLKDTPYWVPVGLNISNGTNEWVITYRNPNNLRRDLFICADDGLITPSSGAMERAYDQYAPFCRIMTDENVEYTF